MIFDYELLYKAWKAESKGKNGRTQILNMDKHFKTLLNKRGFDLKIIKYAKGKIDFRVVILPLKEG